MKLLLLLMLVLLFSSKPPVETYQGGRPRYSSVTLHLYKDSTFTKLSWFHFSRKTAKRTGTWRKAGHLLVLHTNARWGKKGARVKILGNKYAVRVPSRQSSYQDAYRLNGDTLYFYSKEDSIKNYSFYKDYYTLIRKRSD